MEREWGSNHLREKSIKLIKTGGLIIIDNVLWHGEVADRDSLDKYTINIREFNNYAANDKRVEQLIVTVSYPHITLPTTP